MKIKQANKNPGRNMPGKLAMKPSVGPSGKYRKDYDDRKVRGNSIGRIDEIPETSPEVIRECVAKVQIALNLGNEQQAIAAIRYAFANELCPSEPHDPRELGDDEPLAATILGCGPNVKGDHQMYIRCLDVLERYGFFIVGQVRSAGYGGIMRIPFVSETYADIIAEAVGLNKRSQVTRLPSYRRTSNSR